ncbi:hypothetical protein MK079_05570 [Candidatus Gracilibacteria bacterium]|nr:hypothetical protein [Candidatus Gracilibacteria bacterium]
MIPSNITQLGFLAFLFFFLGGLVGNNSTYSGGFPSPESKGGPILGLFGRFLAFLELFRAFFDLKISEKLTGVQKVPKRGGGSQPFWTSPEICGGKLNEPFPKGDIGKLLSTLPVGCRIKVRS